MKCVYEAADVLEAHVIQGLLEQHRISSFIQGEYLLGAVGELPASRLVRILVNDEDLTEGASLMQDYDSYNHPLAEQASIAEGGLPRRPGWLLIIMMVMLAVMLFMQGIRYLL